MCSDEGDRVGFQGQCCQTVRLGLKGYADIYNDFLESLAPLLEEAYRVLKPLASLYFHIDYREVHYAKVLLDAIFGRDSFIIIQALELDAK